MGGRLERERSKKVFISWSGERSGRVAEGLREWLPYIFEFVEPWVSRSDIEAGARWGNEIQEELAATSFGILCLTRENVIAPWLLFEAGALAKTVSDAFVVPYLIGLPPSDVPSGPLAQFQAKKADRQGTWEVVTAINAALKERARDKDKLSRVFDRWWPDLEADLAQVSTETERTSASRPVPDMVEEILIKVRSLERLLSLGGSPSSLAASISADQFDELMQRNLSHSVVDLFGPGNPAVKRKLRELLLARERERAALEAKKAAESVAQEDSAPNPIGRADV